MNFSRLCNSTTICTYIFFFYNASYNQSLKDVDCVLFFYSRSQQNINEGTQYLSIHVYLCSLSMLGTGLSAVYIFVQGRQKKSFFSKLLTLVGIPFPLKYHNESSVKQIFYVLNDHFLQPPFLWNSVFSLYELGQRISSATNYKITPPPVLT